MSDATHHPPNGPIWRDPWPDLVGREEEKDALQAATLDEPLSVLIEGEAGIGKSALVHWLEGEATRRGFSVLRGQCYESPDAGPYFPFFQISTQLQRRAAGTDRLEDMLSGDLPLAAPGTSWLATDLRAARQSRLRSLCRSLIEATQGKPTIMAIEDAQWADAASLLLLNHLLDLSIPTLALVATRRTDECAETSSAHLLMRIRQKAHRILLRGLDETAVRDMAARQLGGAALSLDEVRALTNVTRGVPLFVQELLVYWQQTDAFKSQRVTDLLATHRIPSELGSVIDLRLRTADPALLSVVSSASPLRGRFRAELVSLLAEVSRDVAADALEAAVTQGILRLAPDATLRQYEFAHDLYRKHLYDRLEAGERRRLHSTISRSAQDAMVVLDLDQRALHAALGADAESASSAIDACKAAAEQAERMLAFEGAARSWELALECASDQSAAAQAELWRRLGWAVWAAGKWQQALHAWREAALRFEGLEDDEHLAEVALALADVHRWRGELEDCRQWAERAAALPLATVDDRALAAALLGDAYSLEDRHVEASLALEEAFGYWQEGAHPAATLWMAHGFLMLGELDRAHRAARDGLSEAIRRGAADVTALLANSLLLDELSALDRVAAQEHLGVMTESTDRHDVAACVALLTCESLFYGSAGNWQRVLDLVDKWTAEFRLAGPFQVATARMIAAAARLALGWPSQAEELIRRALPDVETLRPSATLYLAEARLRQGDSREPTTLVNSCEEDILRRPRLAATRALLGQVASLLDDPPLWARCYESLIQERRTVVIIYHCVSVQRVLGRLATRRREWNKAIDHFDLALEHCKRAGFESELALALSDYAEMRRSRRRKGDERNAAALETRARDLCSRIGMPNSERPAESAKLAEPFGLTTREVEVLELAAQGLRNREIADRLILSERTVQRHLENTYAKMAVTGRAEAVLRAIERGIILPRSARALVP